MTPLVVIGTHDRHADNPRVMAAARPDHDREGRLLLEARRHPQVFGELYELTEHRVVGYFVRRTACAATAADLTAETFAAALHGLRRYDPHRGSGMRWLFGIASHLHAQWRRSQRVEQAARTRIGMRPVPLDELAIERIDALLDVRPILADVGDALDELSPAVRDAVVLRVVDELAYDQVAASLGCSPGAARVRVSRGLDQLERRLEATWRPR